MNNKELIEQLSNDTATNKATIDRVLKGLAEVAGNQLKTNGSFVLHGIGSLQTIDAAAREGRNPATGETIHIPAKKRIKLKASKALKEAVA